MSGRGHAYRGAVRVEPGGLHARLTDGGSAAEMRLPVVRYYDVDGEELAPGPAPDAVAGTCGPDEAGYYYHFDLFD